jgi:hypothetical protein
VTFFTRLAVTDPGLTGAGVQMIKLVGYGSFLVVAILGVWALRRLRTRQVPEGAQLRTWSRSWWRREIADLLIVGAVVAVGLGILGIWMTAAVTGLVLKPVGDRVEGWQFRRRTARRRRELGGLASVDMKQTGPVRPPENPMRQSHVRRSKRH